MFLPRCARDHAVDGHHSLLALEHLIALAVLPGRQKNTLDHFFVDVHGTSSRGTRGFHEVQGLWIIISLISVERNDVLGTPEHQDVPATGVGHPGDHTPDGFLWVFVPFGRPHKGILSSRRPGKPDDFGCKLGMYRLQRLIGLTDDPTAGIAPHGEKNAPRLPA